MSARNHVRTSLCSSIALAITAALAAGCGGGSAPVTAITNPNTTTGPAFVIGTDAPVAGVLSFSIQIQGIDAVDASGTKTPLLSGSPTVDFARYNGLQTLLDLNDVPVGTYTSVNVTLGAGSIRYLQTTSGQAPTIQTQTAMLTQSTVTIPLSSPLVVAQSSPVGLRLDFDLHRSIQVDSGGQITGQVNPTFDVKAVLPTDAGGMIDDFDAAVVSVNASGQSFVIQGPHGRQFTVLVNGQTEFEGNDSLTDLTNSSIVQISGTIDRSTSTIDATDVAILSQDHFHASGQVTYVQPPSGAATNFDLDVRELLPTTTGLTLGQIAQVNLSGSEKYFIYWMHNPLTKFLFNSSSLLPGQHVSIGGPASGAANPQAVTVKRVVLRNWGFNGVPIASSIASNTFQMNVVGFAGQLIPGPATVVVSNKTEYRSGLTSLSSLTGTTNVRVVGLLLKDPVSGQPVILARYVDELN